MKVLFIRSFPSLITACALAQAQSIPCDPSADWLVNPAPYKAQVRESKSTGELILENGLARRVIRLTPNAATVTLENLVSGEHLLRAVAPEARVNIDGTDYPVGGLTGQSIQNYLKADWIKDLRPLPGSYQFSKWEEQPVSKRLEWKKHPEWLAKDHPWPPPGKHVVMYYDPPVTEAMPRPDLPRIAVHYELYDGIPLFSKWITVTHNCDKPVRLRTFTSHELKLAEIESSVNTVPATGKFNLCVETDMAFGDMMPEYANPCVRFLSDPEYPTQVHYECKTPCLLRCAPPLGPDQEISKEKPFECRGRDWDGILHANPGGTEKGLACLYNPLAEDITREIRMPLHYTGLAGKAMLTIDGGPPGTIHLDSNRNSSITVRIPAQSRTFLVFSAMPVSE